MYKKSSVSSTALLWVRPTFCAEINARVCQQSFIQILSDYRMLHLLILHTDDYLHFFLYVSIPNRYHWILPESRKK